MFPPTGRGGPELPGAPPTALEEPGEGPGGEATVMACAARDCENNQDGKCNLPNIRVGPGAKCESFTGEKEAPEEEGPRPPLRRTAGPPPPPSPARG